MPSELVLYVSISWPWLLLALFDLNNVSRIIAFVFLDKYTAPPPYQLIEVFVVVTFKWDCLRAVGQR